MEDKDLDPDFNHTFCQWHRGLIDVWIADDCCTECLQKKLIGRGLSISDPKNVTIGNGVSIADLISTLSSEYWSAVKKDPTSIKRELERYLVTHPHLRIDLGPDCFDEEDEDL